MTRRTSCGRWSAFMSCVTSSARKKASWETASCAASRSRAAAPSWPSAITRCTSFTWRYAMASNGDGSRRRFRPRPLAASSPCAPRWRPGTTRRDRCPRRRSPTATRNSHSRWSAMNRGKGSPARRWVEGRGLLASLGGRGVPVPDRTADEGAWRAAAAAPQYQFGRQQLYPGWQAGCRDALEQPVAGPFAEPAHGLVDGGQRRLAQVAGEDVVEPDHGDLFRYPDPGRGERSQDSDGHLVVGGDHGVRELALAFSEDPLAGHQPAIDIVRAVGGAG